MNSVFGGAAEKETQPETGIRYAESVLKTKEKSADERNNVESSP